LLDAQRTQLDAEDSVAQAEMSVNVAVVAIYKALGGVGQPLSDAAPTKVAQIQ
jgi:multidrug efflux system outer membrane protein